MADTPAAYEGPYKELTADANIRLASCVLQKNEFDPDIRESYFFSQPHRAREIRSAQAISPTKPTDADTLQTGVAMELVDDFNTEVINSFMPQNEPWAERRPGMFIANPADIKIVKDAAKEGDGKIFDAIRASNLYEEFPKLGADVAIGTAAFSIDDLRPAENIVVQAIPLHEIEIDIGPFGGIDTRFIVRHTKNRHVKALLGATYEKLDAECKKDVEDPKKQDQVTIIRWGWWRKWDRNDNVVWQHVVMKDLKVVHAVDLVGEGSCPMVVFRFNPSPEWAYGWGPLPKSLPDLRQLDDLGIKKIEYIDLTLAPPFTYPDDSSTAWGDIESGKGYPVRPGTGQDVRNIFDPGSMEPAIFEVDVITRTLQRRFYIVEPEQRGKTPPTATQWLDQMQLAQRRFGTPGASFWREGPAQIFLRFKHLLEKRGIIKPIEVNGKVVSLEPYNPAQRAAEQQEVAMAARFMELVGPTFPEEFRLRVDGSATMIAMAEKMRVTGLVKFRDDETVGNVLNGIKQLAEGRQQIRPGDPAAVGPQ